MSNPNKETILTTGEIITLGDQARAIEPGGNGYILPIKFARAIEQAVLTKLAEQKPIAYIYDDEVYGNDSGAISDYIREQGTPLYAHPTPTK